MQHYDCIFLVISSSNLAAYAKMKAYTRSYFQLFPNVKLLFIEWLPNDQMMEKYRVQYEKSQTTMELGDTLYCNGIEKFELIYEKSKLALQYIDEHYDYPFVIRTNLSTFWNIPKALEFLKTIPNHNFACGHRYLSSGFLGGISITMSRDASRHIINSVMNHIEYDDVLITYILEFNNVSVEHTFIYERNCGFCCSSDDTPEAKFLNDAIYYRIKNDNRERDLDFFSYFYMKHYGLLLPGPFPIEGIV